MGVTERFSGRSGGEDGKAVQLGPLWIEPHNFVATLEGERLQLTYKEFQLLALFASRPGRVLSRELISAAIWDGRAPGRTIDIHVARLRRQLPPEAIETVVRVGYRFTLS